ncbi:MAG: sugar transferase [Dehalococcoidia bacterium]
MNYACKRALDVVCAAIALAALSPLLLLIALLIKLDSPGPALFKQRRIGRGERLFTMIKFRTMYDGADDRLHRESVHRTANGIRTETSDGKLAFKSLEDPRITRVGKVLRAWSLDELPQLFNTLRGEMSVVGPRPALEYELPYYKTWHRRRFEVLPGITGLWQVKRKDQETFDDMMRLDVEYAQSCSVWNDIKLIAMTIPAIVRERGVF